jgi:hypothetical protein
VHETRMRWFHWHCYIKAVSADSVPTPEARKARLADEPARWKRAPVELAEWITMVTYDQGDHFAVWLPYVGQWQAYTAPDQADLRIEYIRLAAQGQSVYVKVRAADGRWLQVSAEAVTAEDCRQLDEHQTNP